MSTRPDIIPAELIEELELLQDQVLANDLPIVEILKTKYNPVLLDRITELSTTLLASASISQVYTGILDGTKPVIFKIQRPEARLHVLSDIQLMRDLVQLVERIDSSLKNMNFIQFIDTFEQNMIAELNFIQEKENTLLFSELNLENENLHIPEVYQEFCTTEVLCIEQMNGIRISEINAPPSTLITQMS